MLNEYAQIAHQKFLAREREKLRADKRLRDAAPDLLAALQSLVVNDGRISGVSLGALAPMVKRAIAKAEGG